MKRKRGFTLIELLTVISILGLISSVVLANIQNSREKAKKAAGAQFHASTQHILGAETEGAWEFDAGPYGETPTTLEDSSGNGHTGQVYGGVTYDINTYNNQGFSLNFDGTTGYITGTGIDTATSNSGKTLSVWVYPSTLVGSRSLFTTGSSALTQCDSFGMSLGSLGKLQTVSTKSASASTLPLTANVWQHVAMVYRTDGVVETYINGKYSGSVTSAGTNNCDNEVWNIARRVSTSDQYFSGNLDSMRVYNEALTAQEIGAVYASEKQKAFALREDN